MVNPDFNKEEVLIKAARELMEILNQDSICYEVILNPDRKWYQFWKPKTITRRLENDN